MVLTSIVMVVVCTYVQCVFRGLYFCSNMFDKMNENQAYLQDTEVMHMFSPVVICVRFCHLSCYS